MRYIKPFIESKTITPTEDLFVDLTDYGFKLGQEHFAVDGDPRSTYEFKYTGKYNMIDVIELYNDVVVKLETFKGIIQTSFAAGNRSVKITFKVNDITDNENHITIKLSRSVMNLLPISYWISSNRPTGTDKSEVYSLQIKCLNEKGNIVPIEWYNKDGGIKNSEGMMCTVSDIRHFTIDEENATKVLNLIKSGSLRKSYNSEISKQVKNSFDRLTPKDLIK